MHTVRWEVTCWNFLITLFILPSKQLVLWASSSAKRVAWDISEWSGSQTSGIAAVQCTVKYINIYAVVWPLKSIVLVQKWYMYQKQSHSLKLFYGACPPDPPSRCVFAHALLTWTFKSDGYSSVHRLKYHLFSVLPQTGGMHGLLVLNWKKTSQNWRSFTWIFLSA